jgi:hypothetical protein
MWGWGAEGLAMAGRCGSAAGPRWISGRGAAICGAAGRGGAAKCGAGRGATAGRCGGGAARNAGAAGRAIAGGGAGRAMAGGAAGRAMAAGGAAGRAMAAGGAAGRAMAAGGAAGRAAGPPPGPSLRSWADAPTFAAITETPRRNAARPTPRGSMIIAPRWFWSPTTFNAQAQRSFAWRRLPVLRFCAAG